MTHQTRLIVATALTGLTAAAVTGCGSTSGTTAGASAATHPVVIMTPTASPPTAAGVTVAPKPTPSASAARAAAGSGAQCPAQSLTITYTDNAAIRDGYLAGMSHADSVVTFTNIGSTACTITGFPGVALLDRSGRQVHQAGRNPVAVARVTLAVGQVASALLSGNTASCDHPSLVAGLLVTAPDQTTSTRLGQAGSLCPDSLTVSPVVRGDTGGVRV